MDEEGIPGLGTYSVPGFGESTEGATIPSSPSQVPGTSGAPSYTPSSTPGGVSTGSPETHAFASFSPASLAGGAQQSPWGSLAGLMGLNAPQSEAGAMKPGQGMKIAQLGMRMLRPATPLGQGAPAPQLSAAGQNPQAAQFQQMFGVDYGTALAMMQMLHPGGTAMAPAQQSQMTYGGGAFQPPMGAAAVPPSPLQPASGMPTAAQPYGVPTQQQARPGQMTLPPLGQGAFQPFGQLAGLPSQMLTGMPQQV